MTSPLRRGALPAALRTGIMLRNRFARAFAQAVALAIFLDFDGTLVDIAPRPELVRLKPAARADPATPRAPPRGQRLPHQRPTPRRTPASISEFVESSYFGLYGWEERQNPRHCRSELEQNCGAPASNSNGTCGAYPTAWIENKTSSLSIHLLAVPRERATALAPRTDRGWLRPFRKSLRAVANLRDVEILPRSIQGKGAAVRRLLAQPKLRGAFPFYFGDDLSDESGFAAVRRGVSVHVGKATRNTRTIFRSHAGGGCRCVWASWKPCCRRKRKLGRESARMAQAGNAVAVSVGKNVLPSRTLRTASTRSCPARDFAT